MVDSRRELAVQCVVAVSSGAASLAGLDAGAAATALSPLVVAGLSRISEKLILRRCTHAAETLLDAADEAGAKTDGEFLEFVEEALSNERRQELLARALLIAQDSAMRDKRRALGRTVAKGVADNGTHVDDELLLLRVIDDLDAPHIRLLRLMTQAPPHSVDRDSHDSQGWMPWMIKEADPSLGNSLYALLLPLQRHGLVWSTAQANRTPGRGMADEQYTVTSYGQSFLERLAD